MSPHEIQVVNGPQPAGVAGVTFQVTLPSGMIVTNPQGFPEEPRSDAFGEVIVAEDGRVLIHRSSPA